eukprot:COSAG02_NODE_2823_length_7948_cov_14.628105_3_plen_477_part_00
MTPKDYDAPPIAGGFGAFTVEQRVSELPEASSRTDGSPLFAQDSLLTGWGDGTAVSKPQPEPEPEPEPRIREAVDPQLVLEQKRTANRLHDGAAASVRRAKARQQLAAIPVRPSSASLDDRLGLRDGANESTAHVVHAASCSHKKKREQTLFTEKPEVISRTIGALATRPLLRTAKQLADIAKALEGSELGTMLCKKDGIVAESCRFLRLGSLRKGHTLCRKGSPAEALYFTAIGNPQLVPPREHGPPGVKLMISRPLGSLIARVGAQPGRKGVFLDGARCAAEGTSVIVLTKKDFHRGNLRLCLTEAALEQLSTYWPRSVKAYPSFSKTTRSARESSACLAEVSTDAAATPAKRIESMDAPSGDASEATDDWVILKPIRLMRADNNITVLHDPRSGALYTFKEVMLQLQLAHATLQSMQVAPGHLKQRGWLESMVIDGWRLLPMTTPAHAGMHSYSPRCVKPSLSALATRCVSSL